MPFGAARFTRAVAIKASCPRCGGALLAERD